MGVNTYVPERWPALAQLVAPQGLRLWRLEILSTVLQLYRGGSDTTIAVLIKSCYIQINQSFKTFSCVQLALSLLPRVFSDTTDTSIAVNSEYTEPDRILGWSLRRRQHIGFKIEYNKRQIFTQWLIDWLIDLLVLNANFCSISAISWHEHIL